MKFQTNRDSTLAAPPPGVFEHFGLSLASHVTHTVAASHVHADVCDALAPCGIAINGVQRACLDGVILAVATATDCRLRAF